MPSAVRVTELGSGFYGDASDGSDAIGSETTLDRTMFYDELVISDVLHLGGNALFCQKLTVMADGIIDADGEGNSGGDGPSGNDGESADGAVDGVGGDGGDGGETDLDATDAEALAYDSGYLLKDMADEYSIQAGSEQPYTPAAGVANGYGMMRGFVSIDTSQIEPIGQQVLTFSNLRLRMKVDVNASAPAIDVLPFGATGQDYIRSDGPDTTWGLMDDQTPYVTGEVIGATDTFVEIDLGSTALADFQAAYDAQERFTVILLGAEPDPIVADAYARFEGSGEYGPRLLFDQEGVLAGDGGHAGGAGLDVTGHNAVALIAGADGPVGAGGGAGGAAGSDTGGSGGRGGGAVLIVARQFIHNGVIRARGLAGDPGSGGNAGGGGGGMGGGIAVVYNSKRGSGTYDVSGGAGGSGAGTGADGADGDDGAVTLFPMVG